MSYKIQYTANKKRKAVHIRLPLMILVSFFLFCMLVKTTWPDGAIFLERLGLFSDSAVMVSALNNLADELQSGDGLISFIRNFARKNIP